MFCFAAEDPRMALKMGAIDTVLVWEDLDLTRDTRSGVLGEEKVFYVEQELDCEDVEEIKSIGLDSQQL
jgi:peptide chain release factor subunit 1